MKIITTLALCFSFFFKSYATEDNKPLIYYPIYCHQLTAFTCLGSELELEDGSLWEVNPVDSHKVFLWSTNDPLVIYPVKNVFSSYNYKIKNLSAKESDFVEVNMEKASVDTKNTLKIDSLDYENNEIILSDESTWKVNLWDTNHKDWLIGDYIIIGLNEASLLSSDKFILINTSVNSYIRINPK